MLGAAGLLLALGTGWAAAPDDCLVTWSLPGSVAGSDGVAARCQDGDPACDADGLPDGACTFSPRVCLNMGGCASASVRRVKIRGGGRAPVARALAGLTYPVATPDVCTSAAEVRVRLGRRTERRATLRAIAADATTDRVGTARLRLTCDAAPSAGRALVVATDFETGFLASVRVTPPHRPTRLPNNIHSDAVIRADGGRVYVVNRYLGDNIQVLDPARGLDTVLQCGTGAGSNPHDIVLVGPRKAYVTRFDRTELWIVDPGAASCAGFKLGQVDLGPFADADGLPEMDQMALVGDRLFVSVERLDRTRNFAPAGRSQIVVLDTATDAVVDTITLTGGNAFGITAGLERDPATGDLVVAEAGNIFKTGDGGLERVDPVSHVAQGFFVTEQALGGNVTDFVLLSAHKGYAVVIDDDLRSALVAFDPERGTATRRMLVGEDAPSDIERAPDGTVWVADRALGGPGLRIFDPQDDRQLTRAPIDVGPAAPFTMVFVP